MSDDISSLAVAVLLGFVAIGVVCFILVMQADDSGAQTRARETSLQKATARYERALVAAVAAIRTEYASLSARSAYRAAIAAAAAETIAAVSKDDGGAPSASSSQAAIYAAAVAAAQYAADEANGNDNANADHQATVEAVSEAAAAATVLSNWFFQVLDRSTAFMAAHQAFENAGTVAHDAAHYAVDEDMIEIGGAASSLTAHAAARDAINMYAAASHSAAAAWAVLRG